MMVGALVLPLTISGTDASTTQLDETSMAVVPAGR